MTHGSTAEEPLTRQQRPAASARSRVTKVAFYSHLWVGVVFTITLVVIAVTGILLNHKRALGLMPDVPNEPTVTFDRSLPLVRLAEIALDAAATPEQQAGSAADIDRMDVRPGNGYVKVRMRDRTSTEVTVDIGTGKVLHVAPRGDVFLEKLHSGETFGAGWILLSDAGAVALVITLITGYWLWVAPKLRHASMEERA